MTSKKFENRMTSLNGYKDINKPEDDRFSMDKYLVCNKENIYYYYFSYVQKYVLG
jgi:hypothetical protein